MRAAKAGEMCCGACPNVTVATDEVSDKRCAACKGPGADDCTECPDGFFMNAPMNASKSKCVSHEVCREQGRTMYAKDKLGRYHCTLQSDCDAIQIRGRNTY